jgi:hypothetical protein
MKKTVRDLFVVFLVLVVAAAARGAGSEILPLSQVKAGMKGIGKSVFEGTRIEEFEAEILGVLRNVQPGRSVILARLKGRGLESTGVIQGMSGSPVYIEGKLVGAVALGFPFSKEAIAGITPIEEMLAIDRDPATRKPARGPSIPIRTDLTLEDFAELYREAFSTKLSSLARGETGVPLNLPLILGGFSSRAFEKAGSFFGPLGFEPVRSGGAGQSLQVPAGPPQNFRPGDPVGLQLVGGDLDVTSVGTVTEVEGNRVLAFGHPMYNLGAVDFAMTKVDVLGIMPALDASFKLAATGPVVGRFREDRSSGVLGEVGVLPDMIPLNVSLQTGPDVRKELKIKIADDKILAAGLVNVAVFSVITADERNYGNLSVDFDCDIYLDNGSSVHLEDLFSGNYDNAPIDVSGLLASVVYFLNNNEFKDIGIFRIDLNLRTVEEARACFLERVLLDKYEVIPGERLDIKVYARTLKEESVVEEVSVLVPPLPAGTEFQIVVGDAISMQNFERSQYRIQEFLPRNLGQLIRILNNLRKNNRIYFKIVAPKPGLFLKGEEMPNLPATLKGMFASPRASSSAPTELSRSTLSEYQLPLPHVFRGSAVIPLKIRN